MDYSLVAGAEETFKELVKERGKLLLHFFSIYVKRMVCAIAGVLEGSARALTNLFL